MRFIWSYRSLWLLWERNAQHIILTGALLVAFMQEDTTKVQGTSYTAGFFSPPLLFLTLCLSFCSYLSHISKLVLTAA